jgi:DNA-binding transcriptional ArsR family regulator
LRKADTFIVSNLMVQGWGIQPDAKSRALRALEKAGLIRIERCGKRSPRVTLVVASNPAILTIPLPRRGYCRGKSSHTDAGIVTSPPRE